MKPEFDYYVEKIDNDYALAYATVTTDKHEIMTTQFVLYAEFDSHDCLMFDNAEQLNNDYTLEELNEVFKYINGTGYVIDEDTDESDVKNKIIEDLLIYINENNYKISKEYLDELNINHAD